MKRASHGGLCHMYRDCNSAAYNSGLLHRYFLHCNHSISQAAKRMTSRLHLGSAPSLDARERPTTFIHQCSPPRLMPCALRVLKAPQPCILQGTLLRQTANSSPLVLTCEASGLTTWQCETRKNRVQARGSPPNDPCRSAGALTF